MSLDHPNLPLSKSYAKYLNAPPHSLHVTVEEAADLGQDLAATVRAAGLHPELVVGLANGAIFPAKIVADTLGIPFHIVRVRRKGTRYKQRLLVLKERLHIPSGLILWGPFRALWVVFQNRTNTLEAGPETFDFDVAEKRVLVVDDCVDTGASLRYVVERLRAGQAAEIRTAVFCWARMPKVDEAQSRPDVHLHRQTQYYPWSNNSRYLKQFTAWLADNNLALWT